MKHDYVLRPVGGTGGEGTGGEIRFALLAHGQVQPSDAASALLTVLRKDPNGFATLLWGDRVICGFVESRNGEVIVTADGGPQTFSLLAAALDAMRQGLLQAKVRGGPVDVKSPIPGLIKAVLVEVNAAVAAGETLAILEAMKMENEIRAPHAGIVERVCASAGQNVAAGTLLFALKV